MPEMHMGASEPDWKKYIKKDKVWNMQEAWVMMKDPANLNAFKESMYYVSG